VLGVRALGSYRIEHFYHLHTINTHTVAGENGEHTKIIVDAEVYEGFPYDDPTMTIPGIVNKTTRDACRTVTN
jgi:hypothetical protein